MTKKLVGAPEARQRRLAVRYSRQALDEAAAAAVAELVGVDAYNSEVARVAVRNAAARFSGRADLSDLPGRIEKHEANARHLKQTADYFAAIVSDDPARAKAAADLARKYARSEANRARELQAADVWLRRKKTDPARDEFAADLLAAFCSAIGADFETITVSGADKTPGSAVRFVAAAMRAMLGDEDARNVANAAKRGRAARLAKLAEQDSSLA